MPVDSKHPEYVDHIDEWIDCQTFFDGEKAVKMKGTRYLPKPEQASSSEYKSYCKRAFFFPAIERTVAGLSGAIDRKAPTIELTERMAYMEDDADSNNASLRQFSKMVLDQCFIKGRYGILVERDQNGSNPYFVMYEAENIINWAEDAKLGITLVVLREVYYEPRPDDPFVMETKKRYRVLKLEDGRYTQTIHTAHVNGGTVTYTAEDITPTRAGVTLNFIPFVFGNVRSITTKVDKPPLLDLVRKNAEHYRVSADYANALYFTGNPILWVKGVKAPSVNVPVQEGHEPPFQLVLGSQRAVYLPNADAEIGLCECSGHGVKPNQERGEDIKKEMAVLGARLLESQRSGVEAAETAYLRQSGEASTLGNIVMSVSSAMRKALEMADIWLGGPGTDINFTLNEDFIDVVINPQLLTTLSDMVSKEYISWDTFFYNLAIGELVPPGRSAEEERDLIESQPPMSPSTAAMMALLPPIGDGQGRQDDEEQNMPDEEEDKKKAADKTK